MDYPDVPYIVKLNSKTNLVKTSQADPKSTKWIDVQQVEEFREDSCLNILGVDTLFIWEVSMKQRCCTKPLRWFMKRTSSAW
jgi:hypothetical protein